MEERSEEGSEVITGVGGEDINVDSNSMCVENTMNRTGSTTL